MKEAITALVAIDEGAQRDLVQASLPADSEVEVVAIVEGFEDSWATLQETAPDVVVVATVGYSERALFFIDGAVKQRPERPVVVLCEKSPNGFVRRVFESGADDLVALPESPEHVGFTLQKALARKQGAGVATGVALAPMICVLGPKGGTGKTLTSCNLAVSLAGEGHRTALVDLDLQFGDVGLALGLVPDKTIYDLVKSGGSLDGEKIDAYLASHVSGVQVLMAPTRPDQASAVTIEFLREVYAALRSTYDYVIVDTPPGFSPEVIASIDSSSQVCMVAMLDSLSLKNTKLGLETLELMGYAPDRVRLVLNRADSRVGIDRDEVVSIVGRAPDVFVPSDRDIPLSVNEGTPIVLARGKSEAARAFHALATTFIAIGAEPSSNGSSNGRRRLLRKRG
ncbi:MAG TPA: AAA family ATPase [Gaiellaceae bacterium]|nr:AAA family ATPase [Gaiellaceae bacterium]